MENKSSVPNIITVTLNPSLDRTLTVHHMAVDYYNHTTNETRLDAAGNGVNISRALHNLNCDTKAIVLLGNDPTGRAYEALIAEEVFPTFIINRDGQTRSDTIVVDTGIDTETHLVEEGIGGSNTHISMILDTLKEVVSEGDFVVLAGMIPSELPPDIYRTLIDAIHQMSAQVLLFTHGEPLTQALKAEPDFVVVRQVDVETQFNIPIRVIDDVLHGAQKICEYGVQHVLVTEVGEGRDALLVAKDEGHWSQPIADVVKGTSSGVVDALIAGVLGSYVQGESLPDALKVGSASTHFTATHFGSEFAPRDVINDLVRTMALSPEDAPPLLI